MVKNFCYEALNANIVSINDSNAGQATTETEPQTGVYSVLAMGAKSRVHNFPLVL